MGEDTMGKEASHSMEITASAVSAAPPAKMWELLCDTSRNPEWVAASSVRKLAELAAREARQPNAADSLR